MFNGKEEVSGDIAFNVQFADDQLRALALDIQAATSAWASHSRSASSEIRIARPAR